MPKFSQIATNNSPAIADFLVGVSTGNVDQKTTIAALAALISLNLTDATILPTKFSNPYKFSAYKSGGNQAITGGIATKVSFQTERFDTNNNYDNVTNFRWTCPVSGFYFINSIIQTLLGSTATDNNLGLYKNGALLRKGGNIKGVQYPQHQAVGFFQLSAGDYIEVYFINVVASDSVESNIASSTFEAFMVSQT